MKETSWSRVQIPAGPFKKDTFKGEERKIINYIVGYYGSEKDFRKNH